jgi:hypothetical protein
MAKTVPTPTGSKYTQGGTQIEMDLDAVWDVSKTKIPALVEEIGDCLDKIADAMNEIRINWVGDSAREADDLNNRYQQVQNSLFGTKKNPEMGVLTRIAGGLQGAVLNLNNAENQLDEAWKTYHDQLYEYLTETVASDTGGDGSMQSKPIIEV